MYSSEQAQESTNDRVEQPGDKRAPFARRTNRRLCDHVTGSLLRHCRRLRPGGLSQLLLDSDEITYWLAP